MTTSGPRWWAGAADRLALGAFAVVAVGPAVWALGAALWASFAPPPGRAGGASLAAWERLGASADAASALGFSLWLAVALTAVHAFAALPLGWWLRRELTAGPLAGLFQLPLAVPPVVAAALAVQLLGGAGLLARAAAAAGLIHQPADWPPLVYDRWGVGIVLAAAWLNLPVFALLAAHLAKNERLEELAATAQTLGATPAQAFRRVVWPVLLGRAAPTLSLYALFMFGGFELPFLLGGQNPQALPVLIYRRFQQFDLSQRPTAFALVAVAAAVGIAGLALHGWLAARAARTAAEGGSR